MIIELEPLITALREELQQYGEMLALLDQQQDLVARRAPAELLDSVGQIQNQAQAIQEARRERQQRQSHLAVSLGLLPEAAFPELVGLLPETYRPLVKALVHENNQLLVKVHQRSRQNHLLLARSVELMRQLIDSLIPADHGPAYDDHGAGLGRPGPALPLYNALG
jgi:small-conductance mechanosensitive channel